MKKVGNLEYDEQKLAELCRELGISYLALFGSYLHGDNTPESDVDLLVKFSGPTGLFKLVGAERKFEQLLNTKVDLLTQGFLSKYFRNEVTSEATPLYEQTI